MNYAGTKSMLDMYKKMYPKPPEISI
jgi:hypothetical protein